MEQIREWDRSSERPVTEEQLLALLEEAVWAPNHHLREPWRFIWVAQECRGQLEETLDPLHHSRLRELIREAPVCLIVAAPVQKNAREATEDFAAACCLIQNLQVLASASGLGMSWHLPLKAECESFCLAAEVRPDERIAGVLGLGCLGDGPAIAPEKPHVQIDVW
jgi:nitroreductase